MLKEILNLISRDGYISISKLSSELKISEELVDEGIKQLLRMGYIIKEETGANCSVACSTCPYAKTCNKEVVRIYSISDKGDSFLKNLTL